MQPPVLHNNSSDRRYELIANDEVLAFADYAEAGDRITLTHTDVPADKEGRGHGSELARLALDDLSARGLHVVPACSFIAAYIRRHPQYVGLVAPEKRHEFEQA